MLDSQCGYAIEANIDCADCYRREDCKRIYDFANSSLEDWRNITDKLDKISNHIMVKRMEIMCEYDEAFTIQEMLEETGQCKDCKLNCPNVGKSE